MKEPLPVSSELSAAELRAFADMLSPASLARKIRAIADILDGRKRTVAAAAANAQLQTLRRWVQRYNKGGLAGLIDRRRGRPRRASRQPGTQLPRPLQQPHSTVSVPANLQA